MAKGSRPTTKNVTIANTPFTKTTRRKTAAEKNQYMMYHDPENWQPYEVTYKTTVKVNGNPRDDVDLNIYPDQYGFGLYSISLQHGNRSHVVNTTSSGKGYTLKFGSGRRRAEIRSLEEAVKVGKRMAKQWEWWNQDKYW